MSAKFGNEWSRNARESQGRSENNMRKRRNTASTQTVARHAKTWTGSEDKLLQNAVKREGTKWTATSEKYFGGQRTAGQCYNGWKSVVKHGLRCSSRHAEENETILEEMDQGMKFPDVAKQPPGRKSGLAKQRLHMKLDKNWSTGVSKHWLRPQTSKVRKPLASSAVDNERKSLHWTDEERDILLKAEKECGKDWKEIAKRLPGRSEEQIKRQSCYQYAVNRSSRRDVVAEPTDVDKTSDCFEDSENVDPLNACQKPKSVHIADAQDEVDTTYEAMSLAVDDGNPVESCPMHSEMAELRLTNVEQKIFVRKRKHAGVNSDYVIQETAAKKARGLYQRGGCSLQTGGSLQREESLLPVDEANVIDLTVSPGGGKQTQSTREASQHTVDNANVIDLTASPESVKSETSLASLATVAAELDTFSEAKRLRDVTSPVLAEHEAKQTDDDDESSTELQPVESSCSNHTRNKRWTAEEDERLRFAVEIEGLNWSVIPKKYFAGVRTDKQCQRRWYRALRPCGKTILWTTEEVRSLAELGMKSSHMANFLPGRQTEHVERRWNYDNDLLLKKGSWTDDEDNVLMTAVEAEGSCWKVISEKYFKFARSPKQCQQRWNRHLRPPGLKSGQFSSEEDDIISSKAAERGMSFSAVTAVSPGRPTARVKEQWEYVLDPSLKKNVPWTEEEDDALMHAREELGNSWTAIATLLPGRSARDVFHRWNSKQPRQFRLAAKETKSLPTNMEIQPVDHVTTVRNNFPHRSLETDAVNIETAKPRWTNDEKRIPLKKRKHVGVDLDCHNQTAAKKARITNPATSDGDVKDMFAVASNGTGRSRQHSSCRTLLDPLLGEVPWTASEMKTMLEAQSMLATRSSQEINARQPRDSSREDISTLEDVREQVISDDVHDCSNGQRRATAEKTILLAAMKVAGYSGPSCFDGQTQATVTDRHDPLGGEEEFCHHPFHDFLQS